MLVRASAPGTGLLPNTNPAVVGCPTTDLSAATVVFTGRVTAVGFQGRTATVAVERVYRGGPVSAHVEVKGTRAVAKGIFSAIDRTYVARAEYVFAPLYGSNPRFEETICSATQARSALTDAVAPPGGGDAPVAGGVRTDVHGSPLPVILGGSGAVVLLVVLVLGTRWLRRRPAARPDAA
jgi:hypothetical protein